DVSLETVTLPTLSGEFAQIAGSLTNLNVADLVSGSADFVITREPVKLSGADASLLAVELSNLSLRVGTADVYASITGSSLSVFALSLQPSDGKSYLAVTASGLGGSLHVGSVASADFAGVSLKVNKASGVGATPIDWADVSLETVTLPTLSGEFAQIAGSLTNLNVADLVSGSADFVITREPVKLSGADASLLAVELSNLSLRVGTADVYASITGSSLSVFALSLQPSDGKSYLAVTASGLGGSLHVGSVASADFAGVSLKVNKASGVGAAPIDWADVSLETVTLPALSGEFAQIAGSLTNLNVADLVSGSADFVITREPVKLSGADASL